MNYMKDLLFGIGAVILGVVIIVIYHWIKAMKDPDVQIATDLRMSVLRYRKYAKLYNDYWDVMMKYGTNATESNQYFAKAIFPELQKLNMDEWRRYQAYREKLLQKQMMDEILNA